MRVFKRLFNPATILLRTQKKILYETIDFNFDPKHVYTVKKIYPTKFRIPNIPYEKQYESRDF